jgi:hypothetical protein
MDTLSEILRDYVNVYKSDGMTGGAIDAALATAIRTGNFRILFDKYFDTSNPSTTVLNLELKAAEKTNFVNAQRDLVTAMIEYHTNNPQVGAPAVGEPQISAVTGNTQNPPHNKYWETLAVAAKIAQGGAPVPPGGRTLLQTLVFNVTNPTTPIAITDSMLIAEVASRGIENEFRTYIASFSGSKKLHRGRLFAIINTNTSPGQKLNRGRIIALLNATVL